MAIEEFGGVRFTQSWDDPAGTDLPRDKQPLLRCRNASQPALSLEGAPLRLDDQHGLDIGDTPLLRLSGGQIQVRVPAGLSIHTGAPPAAALTVTADGNVGIGTGAPAARLQVAGDLKVDGRIDAGKIDLRGAGIARGRTVPGATAWQPYGSDPYVSVFVDVDTSAGKFSTTPIYITSLGGDSNHWFTTGATSIYSPTATSFRVYVRFSDSRSFTPAQANQMKWHINWIGIEQE